MVFDANAVCRCDAILVICLSARPPHASYTDAMEQRFDIAIIGGGAAGLASAIFAAEAAGAACRIAILDGAKKLGAKILVSGGGRCNVTHDTITAADYFGDPRFVSRVLKAFDEEQTVWWMQSLGVELKTEDTGKLFPVTDAARTVLTALLNRCEELGIKILTEHRVQSIKQDGQGGSGEFQIEHTHGHAVATHVIMATGGKSLPRTGSDGAGWAMVKKLGHHVTDTCPALVPLVLADEFIHATLSGIALEATIRTMIDQKLADRRTGSLLFTHFGISGPLAMDASRLYLWAKMNGSHVEQRLSLLPDEDFQSLDRWFIEQQEQRPRTALSRVLTQHFPMRLSQAICKHVNLPTDLPMHQLTREQRRRLVHALTDLPLPIERDRGWNYAEVTAGGVPLSQVNQKDMSSKLVAGLYLVGEMLDCDGRIGGFNFQWAWATGFLAGTAAGRCCK